MGNVINGTYTIRQVMNFTRDSNFKSRFDYKKRDRVKMVKIKTIKYFESDREGAPTILYEIMSKSTPQYKPYFTGKDSRGRKRKSQRKVKHDYETVLQMDRLSINTKNWRARVGTLKKIKPAPQNQIQTIHRETSAKWKKQSEKKFKLKKDQAKWLKETKENHRKKAKYLSDGDYQAQVHGLNLDFIYRCQFVYKINNHLYQLGGYIENRPSTLNPDNIVFFPKHLIAIIEVLMNNGVLKND